MLYDPKWEVSTETKPLEPWQQLLLRAAEVIERDGWIQGHAFQHDGVCMVGAIARAGRGQQWPAGTQYQKMLTALFPSTGGNMVRWNDTPGRTKQQVIDALRKAARS
jgi:hypothetical protein